MKVRFSACRARAPMTNEGRVEMRLDQTREEERRGEASDIQKSMASLVHD